MTIHRCPDYPDLGTTYVFHHPSIGYVHKDPRETVVSNCKNQVLTHFRFMEFLS